MNDLTVLDGLTRGLRLLDRPDSAALARVLSAAEGVDALLSRAHFDHERYVRVPLHADPQFELRLLCWRPGQSSALHDHGASACAFRVIAGTATEIGLDRPDLQLLPGQTVAAEPGVVHQVGNHGRAPLVTLHAYAPALPVDQPSSTAGRRVGVIGGGWCGAALATRLLRDGPEHLRLYVVERHSGLGRGVAYGTPDPEHLLNIPAGQMSLDVQDPAAFVQFARARGWDCDEDRLLPRRLYGDYVVSALRQAITTSPGRMRVVRGEAVDLIAHGGTWEVVLDDGERLKVDRVVLATGNAPPRVPDGLLDLRNDPGLVLDPWAALPTLAPDARLLVVGTGLTALDVLFTLRRQGHRVPVLAMSRHGRWPLPHLPQVVWRGEAWPVDVQRLPRTVDGIAQWLRYSVDAARAHGVPWQAVLQAFKPHLPALWARLEPFQRARFLQHQRSAWEIIRHRAPADLHRARESWEAEGWLRTRSGRILGARRHAGGLRVELPEGTVEVDHVLLCTGAESDVRRLEQPLWRNLLARGLVVPDPLGLGILTDDQHGVVGLRGPVPGLWAVGGLLRPRLWESTSVPDLVPQVETIGAGITAWYERRSQDWVHQVRDRV